MKNVKISTLLLMYINKNFYPECTKTSCTPAAGEADPELFKDFRRSLWWDISVPERTVLTLDFPAVGLEEIPAIEKCKDGNQLSVSTTRSDGSVKVYSYCSGGKVSSLNLLGPTSIVMEVPKDGELDQTVFNAKAAPRGEYFIEKKRSSQSFAYKTYKQPNSIFV